MAFIHFPLCSVKGDVSLCLFPVVPRVISAQDEGGHQDYLGCCPAMPSAFCPCLKQGCEECVGTHVLLCVACAHYLPVC